MSPEELGAYLAVIGATSVPVRRVVVPVGGQTLVIECGAADAAVSVPEMSPQDDSAAALGELLRSIVIPKPSAGV